MPHAAQNRQRLQIERNYNKIQRFRYSVLFAIFSPGDIKGTLRSSSQAVTCLPHRILYISSKNTFQKGHFSENLFSRIDTCQNVRTFGRMAISPKTYFPELTLARMDIWPNGLFPENLFSSNDTCQNVHSMLTIIIQEDEIKLFCSVKPGKYMYYIRFSSTAVYCAFLMY